MQSQLVKCVGHLLKAFNIINRYIVKREIGGLTCAVSNKFNTEFERFIRSLTFWSRVFRPEVLIKMSVRCNIPVSCELLGRCDMSVRCNTLL